MKLENFYFISLFILQVFIYGENEHECKEDSSTPQEMPNIMTEKKFMIKLSSKNESIISPIKIIHENAVLVDVP